MLYLQHQVDCWVSVRALTALTCLQGLRLVDTFHTAPAVHVILTGCGPTKKNDESILRHYVGMEKSQAL